MRLRPPPEVCAECGYDISGLDYTRSLLCPECGKPISVRTGGGVGGWIAWSLALLMPVYCLMLFGVALLLLSIIDGAGFVSLVAAGLLVLVGAVSMASVHALVKRPMRRLGVFIAWALAMLPLVLALSGCVLGVIWPMR